MAGPGGARPGAGRPRNSVKYADQIKILNDAIARDVEKLYKLAVKQAEDGDGAMTRYLLDRMAGKPTQAVELSGEDGNALQQAIQIYLPDNGRGVRHGDSTATGTTGDVAGEPG